MNYHTNAIGETYDQDTTYCIHIKMNICIREELQTLPAALKFDLDQFLDIIWGFPIEIETDCQALKDVLANTQTSVAHAH